VSDHRTDNNAHTIYLDCTDGSVCEVAAEGISKHFSGSTAQVDHVASEVQAALAHGNRKTSLNTSVWHQVGLANHLDGFAQTYDAPMLASHSGYWDTVSRPYEPQLVDKLRH